MYRGPLTRSCLLAIAVAAAVGAQDPAAPPASLAEAYERALAAMKTDKAPGLVFVLPPADRKADAGKVPELVTAFAKVQWGQRPALELKTARDVLLAQVQLLRARRDPVTVALRLLTVSIVAEPEQCGAEPGETMVLLSPTGKRLQGFDVDLGDAEAVIDALTPKVLARSAVEPRRANVEPKLAKAVARYRELWAAAVARRRSGADPDQEETMELNTLFERFTARLTAAAPALVEFDADRVSGEPSPDDQATLAAAADTSWLLRRDEPLPYGTATDKQWDNCPGCGMMAAPLAARSTLKLLAK
ncbi:MAG: hypothetical protein KDE27_24295 [Planctomycetes bacterium]|nr:hypothetical protein [Planctomycetota bacterium]